MVPESHRDNDLNVLSLKATKIKIGKIQIKIQNNLNYVVICNY